VAPLHSSRWPGLRASPPAGPVLASPSEAPFVDDVGWVRPPEPIRGLDHLGAQAPCTALYAQLLPGITNVTDRARYYSFHPWLLWAFEQRYTDHSLDSFRRVLRRAECLFALTAIRHSRSLADADEGLHGAGMVGRFELLRIGVDTEIIQLDEYATLEGTKRYFKNKLGGLGQYYFGPLRDLRILDHSPQGIAYPPGYDRERGREVAEAFAHGVPEDAFFRVLEAPSLEWSDLDALAPFCPCGLRSNGPEHALLLDLFLMRTTIFKAAGGEARRSSLALMLDLAGRNAQQVDYAYEGILRGAAYSGALPDGTPWDVDAALLRARKGWGTYQRNELLSLAIQGLFAAILRAVERDRHGVLDQAVDAGDVGVQLLSSFASRFSRPLEEVVAEVRAALPPLESWLQSDHELQRGWRLQTLRLDDDKLEAAAEESVEILLALLARGVDEYPYADFELDPEYFDPQEIHLLSLRHAWRTTWAGMNVGEWVRWLSVHWCIGRHLRVALRKLRGERRDTFRIRPLERELRVVEAPPPTYTIPRVGRTVQILRDLGLIDFDEEQAVFLTDRGRVELEACRGR
jgi:hypothetical protein